MFFTLEIASYISFQAEEKGKITTRNLETCSATLSLCLATMGN